MHNASEFNCNSCKQLDDKVQYKLNLPNRALYIKRHREEKDTHRQRRKRDRGEHTAQGTKKAKPERET